MSQGVYFILIVVGLLSWKIHPQRPALDKVDYCSLASWKIYSPTLDKVDWIRLCLSTRQQYFYHIEPPLKVERIQSDTGVSHLFRLCAL
jgi:hypothetical protein